MSEGHWAVALVKYERPVGKVQSYVVTCSCGWVSKHTRDWNRSLTDHWRRVAEPAS